MKQKVVKSTYLMVAAISVFSLALYAGCSNDEEESEDAQKMSLATRRLTRSAESGGSTTPPPPPLTPGKGETLYWTKSQNTHLDFIVCKKIKPIIQYEHISIAVTLNGYSYLYHPEKGQNAFRGAVQMIIPGDNTYKVSVSATKCDGNTITYVASMPNPYKNPADARTMLLPDPSIEGTISRDGY